jgi:type II secretory pathway pseudopilin PulG
VRRFAERAERLRRDDGGFTVIEVTVALTLFSVMTVGIVAMQAAALRTVSLARARTQQAQVAGGRIEYVRSNSFTNIGVVNAPAGELTGTLLATDTVVANGRRFTISTHVFPGPSDSQGGFQYKQVEVDVTSPDSARVTRYRTTVEPTSLNAQAHQAPQIAITSPTVDGATFAGRFIATAIATSPNTTGNRMSGFNGWVLGPDGTRYDVNGGGCNVAFVNCVLDPSTQPIVYREISPSASSLTYQYAVTASIGTQTLRSSSGTFPTSLADSPNAYTLVLQGVDEVGRANTDVRQFYVDNAAPVTAATVSLVPAVNLILVNWTAGVDLRGIASYHLLRAVNSGAYIDINPGIDPSTLSVQDLGATLPGSTYSYIVRSCDFAGHCLDSQAATYTFPVSVSTTTVTLPVTTTSLPLPTTTLPLGVTTTTVVLPTTTTGATTTTAATTTTTVANHAPQWPTGATLVFTKSSQGGTKVTIIWVLNQAVDVDLNFQNQAAPAGYYVDRWATVGVSCASLTAAEQTGTTGWTHLGASPTVSALTTQYQDTSAALQNNKTYCYRVFAMDAAAAASSALFVTVAT